MILPTGYTYLIYNRAYTRVVFVQYDCANQMLVWQLLFTQVQMGYVTCNFEADRH